MKRSTAMILAALVLSTAALSGCAQSGNNNAASAPSDTSTAASSQDSSVVESTESEISDTESSVVSEAASAESSEENSKTSKAESSDNKSKTESSKTKTEEKSKPESSKTETSKTETSKTETSKAETSKTEEIKATGISIDLSTLSLTAGYGQELNAYIKWSNNTSSYQGITWSSSNSSVASVSSSGYVTAKSAGTATITASYGSFSKSCTVTVKAAQQPQPAQPSGGGNSGNGGSNNGGSGSTGNGGSNNGGSGGQTSKPSGGGNSGSNNGGSSTLTLAEKAKRAGFDLNVYNEARLKGVYWSRYGLPDNGIKFREVYPIQNFDKSARIKVESREGNEVYEVPELLAQVNKRRALLGLSPVSWDGYTKENAEETKKLYANMDKDQLQCVIDLHPSWFKDGKITDWGVKELYKKSSTDACDSMDYALSHSLQHDGGSNINASVKEFNAKEWIDGIENSPMHWSAIVDPNAETFYALASPGPNGTYTLCIWCA